MGAVKIKFIILTAHNNFEYARKSISPDIYEYILKPFKDEKLIEAAKGAIKKIEAEQSSEVCVEELSKQLENCRFFLKDYFLPPAPGRAAQQAQFSIFSEMLNIIQNIL